MKLLNKITENRYITRNGRVWKAIAGFQNMDVFIKIKTGAHSSEEWKENESQTWEVLGLAGNVGNM